MNTNIGSFVFILNAAFIVILSDAQHPAYDPNLSQQPVHPAPVAEYAPTYPPKTSPKH